jgi:hypothetical protein
LDILAHFGCNIFLQRSQHTPSVHFVLHLLHSLLIFTLETTTMVRAAMNTSVTSIYLLHLIHEIESHQRLDVHLVGCLGGCRGLGQLTLCFCTDHGVGFLSQDRGSFISRKLMAPRCAQNCRPTRVRNCRTTLRNLYLRVCVCVCVWVKIESAMFVCFFFLRESDSESGIGYTTSQIQI